MKMESMEQLRFPVGRFSTPGAIDSAARLAWIDEIAAKRATCAKRSRA
jgi:hypothetical protein